MDCFSKFTKKTLETGPIELSSSETFCPSKCFVSTGVTRGNCHVSATNLAQQQKTTPDIVGSFSFFKLHIYVLQITLLPIPISLNDAVIPQYPMAWFRSLIQVSATARSATKPRILDPFSYTLLSRFSSEPAPIHETPAPSPAPQTPTQYSGLGPTKPGEKPRVVVLGTGWAGCRLMKGLDTDIYDVVCVSPRNHMVFTPLLASTCVGTLEFRSVAEPIGRIQPAISREPGSYFFLSNCVGLDPDKHLVRLVLFGVIGFHGKYVCE